MKLVSRETGWRSIGDKPVHNWKDNMLITSPSNTNTTRFPLQYPTPTLRWALDICKAWIKGLKQLCVYRGRIAVAWGPFGPSWISNSTSCPSLRLRYPRPSIAEKCAKMSAPPMSGVMKPKPLSALNHLTFPF